MSRQQHRLSRAALWSLYWEQGLSLRQIGARLSISMGPLHRAMVRFGIELRPRGRTEGRCCGVCGELKTNARRLCREHLREYYQQYQRRRRAIR